MDRLLLAAAVVVAGMLLALETAPSAPAVAPTQTIAPSTMVATATPAPEATLAIAPATPAPTPTPTPAPQDIDGARVVIDRLGIDLPLHWGDVGRDVPRDGFAGATPERSAFVFPGSALPGAGGNTYIYSHARTGMFLSLWQARRGDLVILRWPDGSERGYRVSQIEPRVDPTDTSWLNPRGPERLTLQTSTGPRASDPRFIVVASPIAAGS